MICLTSYTIYINFGFFLALPSPHLVEQNLHIHSTKTLSNIPLFFEQSPIRTVPLCMHTNAREFTAFSIAGD